MNGTDKTLIIIDDSNFYYAFRKLAWDLDYQKFYNWFTNNFNILDIYFFGGIISKKTFFDKHPKHTLTEFNQSKNDRKYFFKLLKRIGYIVRTKPVASLYDNSKGEYKRKCNFDVEITILALDRLNEYKELVLCSGDGDFTKLLKYAKGKYKKTTLIAHKDRLNWNLQKTANRVIFIDELRTEIQK